MTDTDNTRRSGWLWILVVAFVVVVLVLILWAWPARQPAESGQGARSDARVALVFSAPATPAISPAAVTGGRWTT